MGAVHLNLAEDFQHMRCAGPDGVMPGFQRGIAAALPKGFDDHESKGFLQLFNVTCLPPGVQIHQKRSMQEQVRLPLSRGLVVDALAVGDYKRHGPSSRACIRASSAAVGLCRQRRWNHAHCCGCCRMSDSMCRFRFRVMRNTA